MDEKRAHLLAGIPYSPSHPKDEALFGRIDATLAEYDEAEARRLAEQAAHRQADHILAYGGIAIKGAVDGTPRPTPE